MNPVVLIIRVIPISRALPVTSVDAVFGSIAHAFTIEVVLLVLVLDGEVVSVAVCTVLLSSHRHVLTMAESVTDHAGVPLNQVDDPSEQD